jgi:hypothetical protein
MFLDHFDVLISNFLKIKKNYFNIFLNKNHFKKQSQLYSQKRAPLLSRLLLAKLAAEIYPTRRFECSHVLI